MNWRYRACTWTIIERPRMKLKSQIYKNESQGEKDCVHDIFLNSKPRNAPENF